LLRPFSWRESRGESQNAPPLKTQSPVGFCLRHPQQCTVASAFPENESLQLRWFRQTLRICNGNAPLILCRERIGQMTKNELIAAVADKAQMTKTAAASAVDATFDAITAALKKGGEVKIMGFGNFRVVKRAAREGRDPRTGAPVKIKAARRPRFSAGKGLKDAVNK
jgi:DNA-binding protein HU-beta